MHALVLTGAKRSAVRHGAIFTVTHSSTCKYMPFYKMIDDYCGLWNLEQCGSIGSLRRPPNQGPKCSQFHAVFWQSRMLVPPLEVWRPLLQEVCLGVSAQGVGVSAC